MDIYMNMLINARKGLLIICFGGLFGISHGQGTADWKLDRMPAGLETELALSALPTHLRGGATVYLLDPDKGYYVAQRGSNGFVCFIDRTDWEWGEFRKDIYAPMAYDPEGARTIVPVFKDVAAMRASGKYTGKPGDGSVMTMSMPHYMFYAPYVTGADMGIDNSSPTGPWWINSGDAVLGKGKGPHGFVVMAASEAATAKILANGKDLLKRLADYSPYFRLPAGDMHH
jgi:hypothetical protein